MAPELRPESRGAVISDAGFYLRALNRLAEAGSPMRESVEIFKEEEAWDDAAVAGSNLSELELTLGNVAAAETTAVESVAFADRPPGNLQWRTWTRVTHADALHHAGHIDASRVIFGDAEKLHAERKPKAPLLYSVQGYKYCDLLLAPVERAAWKCFLMRSRRGESATHTGGGRVDITAHFESLDSIDHRASQTLG